MLPLIRMFQRRTWIRSKDPSCKQLRGCFSSTEKRSRWRWENWKDGSEFTFRSSRRSIFTTYVYLEMVASFRLISLMYERVFAGRYLKIQSADAKLRNWFHENLFEAEWVYVYHQVLSHLTLTVIIIQEIWLPSLKSPVARLGMHLSSTALLIFLKNSSIR